MAEARANYHLKEDIRAYWSARAASFDLSPGHGIRSDAERQAWQALIGGMLGGARGGRVLELASGTGEVTRLLLDLGCDVTGLDLSDAMLDRARAKLAGRPRLRLHLGDAEYTREPDCAYDAVVCRHLVWTLVDPRAALADWHRVLRPGGRLVIVDGDWVRVSRLGRWRARLAWLMDRLAGRADIPIDWVAHAAIMQGVHFRGGLTAGLLTPLLAEAGFTEIRTAGLDRVRRAQRRGGTLAERVRTGMYDSFALAATRT